MGTRDLDEAAAYFRHLQTLEKHFEAWQADRAEWKRQLEEVWDEHWGLRRQVEVADHCAARARWELDEALKLLGAKTLAEAKIRYKENLQDA